MPRRRLPPKLKISKLEAKLLSYPPNTDAWLCLSEVCGEEGGMINGGVNSKCWVCSSPPGKGSLVVFGMYLKACEKVGIAPSEELWRYNPEKGKAYVREINGSGWKVWEPEESVRLEVAQRR